MRGHSAIRLRGEPSQIVAILQIDRRRAVRLAVDQILPLDELGARRGLQHGAVGKRHAHLIGADLESLGAEILHQHADGAALAHFGARRNQAHERRRGLVVDRLHAGMPDQHLAGGGGRRAQHHTIAMRERGRGENGKRDCGGDPSFHHAEPSAVRMLALPF